MVRYNYPARMVRMLYWILPLAFMVLIFHYSTAPIVAVPIKVSHSDKIIHFATYVVLTLLNTYSWHKTTSFSPLVIIILASVFAVGFSVMIEICQPYYGRHFEIADIMANSLGCAFGSCGWYLLWKFKQK